MSAAPTAAPPRLLLAVALVALGALAATGYAIHVQNERIAALTERSATADQHLQDILGEVTRMRIEQSTGTQGPAALLTKLRTYAPILVSARTAQPDFAAAKQEMDAVLRAFAAIGKDAWTPIVTRIGELKPDKNFDELKWLLEAAVRVDPPAGLGLVQRVLLGTELPAPRLRWYAATMLVERDKPLAQKLLRQVLTTESSRGIDRDRAAAYGASIPDTAAFATTGFHNFVVAYIRSEDPQMEETLLMVIGRTEHDLVTIQECIEELGRRKCERAVEPIQKLYKNPPGKQENPIFQTKCLDALAAIQGNAARPFFEEALRTVSTDAVANHLKRLLR